MSSAISGIGSGLSMMSGMGRMQRPDSSQMVEQAFANIDTEGKGYIELEDIEAALDQMASSDSGASEADAEELFSALDSDGDGQVTSDEMSSSVQAFSDTLSALQGMGGMAGMPPPPPPASDEDAGFTEEELTSQLADLNASDDLSEADVERAELLTNVLSQFDTADADGDGRVTFDEAMALEQSSDEETATSTAQSTNNESTTSDAMVMRTIMQLVQTYGTSDTTSALEGLSLSA